MRYRVINPLGEKAPEICKWWGGRDTGEVTVHCDGCVCTFKPLNRQVTYELNTPLCNGIVSFVLIPRKTVCEHQLIGKDSFDQFVDHVKRLGCDYSVVELQPTVPVEGNTDRFGTW